MNVTRALAVPVYEFVQSFDAVASGQARMFDVLVDLAATITVLCLAATSVLATLLFCTFDIVQNIASVVIGTWFSVETLRAIGIESDTRDLIVRGIGSILFMSFLAHAHNYVPLAFPAHMFH